MLFIFFDMWFPTYFLGRYNNRTKGTEWYVKGDPRLRGPYHQKIPRVYSTMEWDLKQAGLRPSPGQTTVEWINCTVYFKNKLPVSCRL